VRIAPILVVLSMPACPEEPRPGLPVICDHFLKASEDCIREGAAREGASRDELALALEGMMKGVPVLKEDAARGVDVTARCAEGLATFRDAMGKFCPNVSWAFP
jgi:hypothetical protein